MSVSASPRALLQGLVQVSSLNLQGGAGRTEAPSWGREARPPEVRDWLVGGGMGRERPLRSRMAGKSGALGGRRRGALLERLG